MIRFPAAVFVAAALVLATPLLGAQGAIPIEDDAGSGGDAGDSPSEAVELGAEGEYEGHLTIPTDADWFALEVAGEGEPICAEATVDGEALANVTLGATGQTLAEGPTVDDLALAEATHDPTEPLAVGLASPGVNTTFLGFTPQYTLPDGSGPHAGIGQYLFDLQVTDVDPETIGSDNGPNVDDAPALDDVNDRANLPPVTGACVAGQLGTDGSQADAYAFEAEAGEYVTLSLATSEDTSTDTTTVGLVAPNGTEVLTLEDGDVTRVLVEESGTWAISLTSDHDVAYGVGLSQDDDDPPPCRPTCMDNSIAN